MKDRSWEKHLPPWAKDYGKTTIGWESDLDESTRYAESRELYACFFGLALGLGIPLFARETFGKWPETITLAGIGIFGVLGVLGWIAKKGMEISPEDHHRKSLAKLKARERKYSDQDLAKVERYRDWLMEVMNAEEIELKSGRLKFLSDWKVSRLRAGSDGKQIRFYDIFLREAKATE